MKRNILLNSFLLLVVSFFLFAFTAKADATVDIKYGDVVDVSEELGHKNDTIKSIIDSTGAVLNMDNCQPNTDECKVKLKEDSGLWYQTAHIIIEYKNDSKPLTLNFNIVNHWPVLVSLGNFEGGTFSYDSGWGDLTLAKTNGVSLEGKTREQIELPRFTGDNTELEAHNGLPIKFVNFVKMVRENQAGYGATLVVTMPVQKAGMCSEGGYLDGVEEAYGTPIDAGKFVNGTGPEVYVACYEYRDFVRLDLGGGEFIGNPKDLGWEWDSKTNSYIATESSPKLPDTSQVIFPYGLKAVKKVVGWVNQDGKEPTGELQLNGDVWSPIWAFDPSSSSTNDKAVGLHRTITISSSASVVTKCEGGSEYVTVEGPNDGKCEITGKLYEEGNVTIVKVTYENGETIEYNVTVINTLESDDITLVSIELENIQDEDPGEGDIVWKECKYYETDGFMKWGSWGVTDGTNLNRSVYRARCSSPDLGSWSVGLCIDPSAPAPAGTYIRDTSWDGILKDTKFIRLVEEIQVDVDACGEEWNEQGYGSNCQNKREASQVVFRLLSVALGKSWNFNGHNDYEIYKTASTSLGDGKSFSKENAEAALNKIFDSSHRTEDEPNTVYGAALHYFEAYIGATGDDGYDITDFKITKTTKYNQVSSKEYYLYYSGKIITPKGINLDTSYLPVTNNEFESRYGYSVQMTKLEKNADGEYTYEATLHVKDASPSKLVVPTSKEDKIEAAKYLELKIQTGVIRDILVIKPLSGAQLQRLLLYDKGTRSLTVFFGPDATDEYCGDEGKLDATALQTCEDEAKANPPSFGSDGVVANDSSATCNYKLYRQCCSIVDEGSYPASFFNICTNSCSYNTLGSVCGFVEYSSRKNDQATLYHVREGYKTIAASGSHQFQKNINICAANVGNYAAATTETAKKAFKKNDGAGNSLNVEAYEGNKYCQVTCREEWDMTMGSFGSYMGAEAVRAGGSFQLDKADLFIRGDRYCYTSYLDTSSGSQYYQDMKGYASDQYDAFDKYSKASHEYTDLTEADTTLTDAFGDNSGGSVTKISATGGSTSGGLTGAQACKQWTKVTYYARNTATQNWCPSGQTLDSKKCYEITDSDVPEDGCPSDAPEVNVGTADSPSYKCRKTTYKGEAEYTFTWKDGEDVGYECTSKSARYQGCGTNSNCHSTSSAPTGYGKTDYYKGKATSDIQFYGHFQLTGNYSDGKCAAGEYVDHSGECHTYGSHAADAVCSITVKQTEGGPDEIKCTYGGLSTATYTAETENLVDKINKKSIGKKNLESGMKMSTAGTSTFVGKYYSDLKTALEAEMVTNRATIADAESSMQSAANQWYQCQNFVLYTSNYTGTKLNDTLNLADYGLSSSFTALGSTGSVVKISTSFDPKVSYYYDEQEYMQLLSEEEKFGTGIQGNVLERNDYKNTAVYKGVSELDVKASEKNEFFNPSYPNAHLGTSIPVELALNASELESDSVTDSEKNNELNISKKSYRFMSSDSVWTGENARTYGDSASSSTPTLASDWTIKVCTIGGYDADNAGSTTPYSSVTNTSYSWDKGGCYNVPLYYYSNVNYIERSVSNSSFFKNKGDWYSKGNAFTTHGDVLESSSDAVSAIQVYNSFHGTDVSATDPEELKLWHLLGSKNIFPVSITTPRNLYKYTYKFSQIGSYNQKEKSTTNSVGRLMGNDNSVFRSNSRTCFYEVIEALCKCCGDESYNHIVTIIETVDSNVTTRYATNHEDQLGKIMSDDEKISTSNQGQIGFFNTVSSLANLSAISDTTGGERALAANWTDTAVFNYNGYNRYVTNKGDVAQKAIEAVGEEIYSPTYSAEYAYTLTPEAIAFIRQDNKITSYGVTFDSNHVKMYGKAKVATDGSSDDITSDTTTAVSMNKEITFEHFGSIFLEETVAGYAKPDSDDGTFKNLNLASKKDVCYINEDSEVTGKDGGTIASTIKQKMNEGCRWVDYLENDGTAVANYMDDYYEGNSNCDAISDDDSGLKNVCKADYRVQSTFRLAFK